MFYRPRHTSPNVFSAIDTNGQRCILSLSGSTISIVIKNLSGANAIRVYFTEDEWIAQSDKYWPVAASSSEPLPVGARSLWIQAEAGTADVRILSIFP